MFKSWKLLWNIFFIKPPFQYFICPNSASERSPFEGSCCGGGYANVDSVPASPEEEDDSENYEPPPPPRYRVVMLGDAGVGKTALVNQFMTSEYMHTYDASLGKLIPAIFHLFSIKSMQQFVSFCK